MTSAKSRVPLTKIHDHLWEVPKHGGMRVPGRIYADERLHLTVYSLLRSRSAPLSDVELTRTWSRWLPGLKEIAEHGIASQISLPKVLLIQFASYNI